MQLRIALLVALMAAGASLCGASRPAPGAGLLRRFLGEKGVVIGGGGRGGGVFIGGGRGGFGGNRCFGPNCVTSSRQQTAQTLAILNAQSAVRTATDIGGPWSTFGATQSASRSAVAATFGDIQYLAFQPTFDAGMQPSPYFPSGKRR